MFKNKTSKKVDKYGEFNCVTDSVGIIFKDIDGRHSFVAQDYEYEDYVVIGESKVEILRFEDIKSIFLDDDNVTFVKLVKVKNLEIVF